MSAAPSNDDRLQQVVDLVEKLLADIASEQASPFAASPVVTKFCMDLQMRLLRINTERLTALMRRISNPGD